MRRCLMSISGHAPDLASIRIAASGFLGSSRRAGASAHRHRSATSNPSSQANRPLTHNHRRYTRPRTHETRLLCGTSEDTRRATTLSAPRPAVLPSHASPSASPKPCLHISHRCPKLSTHARTHIHTHTHTYTHANTRKHTQTHKHPLLRAIRLSIPLLK